MSFVGESHEAIGEHLPDGLVEIGAYATYQEAFQHSVVVLAMASTALPQGYFERLSTITDIESDTTG